MMTRFLLAVVGLALGLAVSVFAQQNDTVGLPMRQEIEAIDAKLDDANKQQRSSHRSDILH
jgi:hypothetical protein